MTDQEKNRRFIAKKIASWFHAGDVVNLGVGVPVLVADYIEDGVTIQSENGLLGVGETYDGLNPEAPYFNAAGFSTHLEKGASVFDICTSFGMIRKGRIKCTVLGCFEVSEYGDLANWARPGSYPGMGGAMDLVTGIKDVIVATDHCTKSGKPKIVKECTLPLTGKGCVDWIVTEMAVFKVSNTDGLTLMSHRVGVNVDMIREKTGAPFKVSPELRLM
jgi:acetate CoA/acetoacetate CoA-transferase beta subunit